MLRLRLLRILVPLLLVGLAIVLYLTWVPRAPLQGEARRSADPEEPRASDIWFVEYEGDRRSVAGDVARLEERGDGGLHLEGIRDLEIHRENGGPLIVNADRGDRTGEEGSRIWSFEERVVFYETERHLRLFLPVLEIDEARGEARSSGEIRLEGPGLNGRCEALVYGLRGQPGELTRPVLHDGQSGTMSARSATLWEATRDVELIGEVALARAGERLDAGRVRLWRGGGERLERVQAAGGVWGSWPIETGAPLHLRADALELEMDENGETRRIELHRDALLRRELRSIGAEELQMERQGAAGSGWRVRATAEVVAQTVFSGSPGLLRADELTATLDPTWAPLAAEAVGRVSFEGRDTRAEADRALYAAGPNAGQIRLLAGDRAKARLSHERMRVAGGTIATDGEGRRLVAEDRVEASLLPATAQATGERRGSLHFFAAGEAIHFVSDRLVTTEGGASLEFIGGVRGWQGERNLSAGRLVVDQRTNGLAAEGGVATRFPRVEQGAAVAESEFVLITADRLDYDDARRLAVYSGAVRVRLDEGWLESARVEVELAASREIDEVRAFETVRLEFQRSASGDLDDPITGEADRAVYRPGDATVLLLGDQAPASVERRGRGGGTTTGRMLAYRLDLGTLEVDSGGQGPASIRTVGR